MKKPLKVALAVVGVVLAGIGGFAAFVSLDWPVKYKTEPVSLTVTPTPERLARGKALIGIRCLGCHYDQKTGGLTGIQMVDAPKAFGTIYSHNITKHPQKGLGRYSDGEVAYLLRTGVNRQGHFVGPFMQSPHLSDEDLASIIAFLRSDDPWVAAQDIDDRQSQASILLKLLMHVAWKPLPMPRVPIPAPSPQDKVALGRYVVHALGDCYACHSSDFKKLNAVEPEKSGGYFAGGNQLLDASGTALLSPNLTPDPETGIGKWSEDDFVKAVRTGVRSDGRALRYPMAPYRELSEDEVRAAFAYLKTIPPIKNAVPYNPGATPPASASDGEKLYSKYACASCHGNDGVGVCDLRSASVKYDTDEKLTAFLHDASKFVPGTKMPTWEGVIAEADYPALVAYVRSLEKRGGSGSAARPTP